MNAEKAIQWYCRHGFSLVPLHKVGMPLPEGCRPGKGPCLDGALYDFKRHCGRSHASLETVLGWWERGHNIGVMVGPISGVVVADLDSQVAIDWALLNLPSTPYRVTTGQGEHWYYRHPSRACHNHQINTIRHIDIKAHDGYVVVPPSIHPSGRVYAFSGPWKGSMPEWDPMWVQSLLRPVQQAPHYTPKDVHCSWPGHDCLCAECGPRRAAAWLKRYPPAADNEGSFVAACTLLHRFRLNVAEALALMRDAYGWDDEELIGKLKNAAKYGRGNK